MNIRLKTFSILVFAAAIAHAQQDLPDEASLIAPGFDPSTEAIDEIPQEILDVRAEMKTLQESLRQSRQATLAEIGEEASREEIVAALSAWKEANSANLAELQALSEELRQLIRENRPDGPWAEVPDAIKDLQDQLQAERKALAESRRAAIQELGDDPTQEEIRDAVAAWREANAEALEDVREMANEIRDWFRENRPDRPGLGNQPGMAQRRLAFRANQAAMKANRLALREEMQNPDLTPEERHAIIQAFREENRELMQERKELMRQQRNDQGGVGGDRRPGG